MKLKDWQIRAIKTFIQAFGGALVPELCIVLTNGLHDVAAIHKVLFPVVCAALAAGISAVWNIVLEELKK